MKQARASRPSAPVARWATSSSAPLARTLNGTLRSAASKASATPASSIGTAHNLISSRPPNLIRRCYCLRSVSLTAEPGAYDQCRVGSRRQHRYATDEAVAGWTIGFLGYAAAEDEQAAVPSLYPASAGRPGPGHQCPVRR